MNFFFEGGSRYSRSFRSVEDFYKRSEILGDLEGLGYAIVTSCINAEKSVIVVPSKYNVVVRIEGVEDFWFISMLTSQSGVPHQPNNNL